MDQAVSITPPEVHSHPAAESGITRAGGGVRLVERSEWESLVLQFGDYSYRQSWSYGVELAQRRGAVSEHVAIERDGSVIGLADVRLKRLPVVGGGLAYISGGPIVQVHSDEVAMRDQFAMCLNALVQRFVRQRGYTLRVVAAIGPETRNEMLNECFMHAGFARTARGEHYRTILLDIQRPLNVIRAELHSHWRRHLNGAERNSLDITFGTELDRFEHVGRMSEALRDRKGFELDLDAAFYADVQQGLSEKDKLIVGLVSQNGVPIAGNITAMHGETAVYLVGASTGAALEAKASYLMHWRTIELAQQRGMKWYDLGGIDPDLNPGVTSFKQRTNGFDVTAAGPYEVAPRGLRRRLTALAESAYLRMKRRKATA